MIIDYFPATIAADGNGNTVKNATAQVYALADTNLSTPLALTDLQGVPMPELRSSDLGIYPAFRVVNQTMQIVVVSGSLRTPMTSLSVYANAAEAAAATASGNAGAAASSAQAAELARLNAVAAQAAAVEAAAEAAAVGSTNDTITEGLIKSATSKTATALNAAIAGALPDAVAPSISASDDTARYRDGVFRGLIPVGDACGTFAQGNKSNGTNTYGYSRSIHRLLVPSQDYRLVYTNFQHGEPGDNPITVSARVEPIATTASPPNPGLLHRVTFNGQDSVTIAPMGLAISDPVPLSVQTSNYYLVVRTQVTVNSGEKWPYARVLNPYVTGSEGRVEGTSATPGIMATTTPTAVAGTYANAYVPFAIIGAPRMVDGVVPSRPRTILGAGDSILHGLGQLPIAGWFGQSIREMPGWTYVAACATGEITPTFFAPNPRAQLLSSRWDYLLHEYGNNECSVLNLVDTKANIIAGWREEFVRGNRVIAMTIGPRTTSTDGWRTTANQTIDATHNGVRVPYNNWLRDGAPINASTFAAVAVGGSGVRIGQAGHPVAALFEFADIVESARDSGKWAPPGGRSFTVTTGANGGVISSPDAAFTSADLYETVWIDNAGTAGTDYMGTVTNVRSATQVDVTTITPSAVTSGVGAFGVLTSDGIHMGDTALRLIKVAFKAFLAALPQ
jgi:hypothetical protein